MLYYMYILCAALESYTVYMYSPKSVLFRRFSVSSGGFLSGCSVAVYVVGRLFRLITNAKFLTLIFCTFDVR